MSLLAAERAEVVAIARRMSAEGLVSGNSGNVSRRVGSLVAATPRNRDYASMTADDVCVLELGGAQVAGERAPSSEWPLHLALYRAFDAGAIVHTHSPFATAVGTVVDELPAIHYQIVSLGGPVRVAPYHLFGSAALATAVVSAGAGRSAALLGTHGAVAWGDDLEAAYRRAVTLEWLAALYWRACQLGSPRILTSEELDEVRRQLDRLDYAGAGR